MDLLLKYLLVGFSIALPLGAISIEMIKQGVRKGFMHGWAVGLGGMTVDFALIIVLYFGFAQILEQPIVQIPLWLIGAAFLFLVGIDSIKQAKQSIEAEGTAASQSVWRTYRNGLLVAISPGNLLFWVSVFGVVLTNSYSDSSSFLTAATGILLGILLHDLALSAIVSTTRKVMNDTVKQWISILAGVVLIGFGCTFIYEFFQAISHYI